MQGPQIQTWLGELHSHGHDVYLQTPICAHLDTHTYVYMTSIHVHAHVLTKSHASKQIQAVKSSATVLWQVEPGSSRESPQTVVQAGPSPGGRGGPGSLTPK